MAHRSSVTTISDYASAQQLKGVIQQCDIMIAARYHTLVAALFIGDPEPSYRVAP